LNVFFFAGLPAFFAPSAGAVGSTGSFFAIVSASSC
jgi:hypothetical protein